MLIKLNEKVLTLKDRLQEKDAFEFIPVTDIILEKCFAWFSIELKKGNRELWI